VQLVSVTAVGPYSWSVRRLRSVSFRCCTAWEFAAGFYFEDHMGSVYMQRAKYSHCSLIMYTLVFCVMMPHFPTGCSPTMQGCTAVNGGKPRTKISPVQNVKSNISWFKFLVLPHADFADWFCLIVCKISPTNC